MAIGFNAKKPCIAKLSLSITFLLLLAAFAPQSAHAQSSALARGLEAFMAGDYSRAVTEFTEVIRLQPYITPAYSLRGGAYYEMGDYTSAIADYTQAIRFDPNLADAYNNRGVAYARMGDYDRAIADFEAALRIDPNDANIRNNLEAVRQQRGQ